MEVAESYPQHNTLNQSYHAFNVDVFTELIKLAFYKISEVFKNKNKVKGSSGWKETILCRGLSAKHPPAQEHTARGFPF